MNGARVVVFPTSETFDNINLSTVNGYPYPWTSTMGATVSSFTLSGTTATTPRLIGSLTFPYVGDYFLTQKVAFTKTSGGLAQDSHGVLLLNGGTLPTFPGGNYGMAALPDIGDNFKSTFTTLVSNIIVSPPLKKNIYYYDPTGNNYTASLIADIPVIHYNPPK